MKAEYDRIEIRELEVFANHGVLPEEKKLGQKFLISVSLYLDTKQAGESDRLSDSVNYAEVAALLERETKEYVFELLEALAEYLAKKILISFSLVQKVDVTIEKPWAPIGIPLKNVSVSIQRKWHDVYLGIGSNMGDKRKNLDTAIRMLSEDAWTRVVRVSEFINTKPVGYLSQDDFLNGAVYVRSLRSPERFLDLIAEIEKELKRERTIRWGPRTIDIDILLYDEKIMQTEKLVIPHRGMKNRGFVLEPLNEIAPYAVHPVTGKTVSALWEELQEKSK